MSNVISMGAHLAKRMTLGQRYVDAIGAEVHFKSDAYDGAISDMTDDQLLKAWAALDLIDTLLGDPLVAGVIRVHVFDSGMNVTLDQDYVRFCEAAVPQPVLMMCDADGRCYNSIRFCALSREAKA